MWKTDPKRSFHLAALAMMFLGFIGSCQAADDNAARLSRQILQADRIEVYYDFEPPGMKLVYSSTSPKDIAEFNAALNVSTPAGESACACIPSPVIRLYRGKTQLTSIEVFGTYAVHTPLRRGDLFINDAEKWLGWFDARKMPRLRKEYEDELARNKQSDEDYAHWLAAMPGSIRPLWDKVNLNET